MAENSSGELIKIRNTDDLDSDPNERSVEGSASPTKKNIVLGVLKPSDLKCAQSITRKRRWDQPPSDEEGSISSSTVADEETRQSPADSGDKSDGKVADASASLIKVDSSESKTCTGRQVEAPGTKLDSTEQNTENSEEIKPLKTVESMNDAPKELEMRKVQETSSKTEKLIQDDTVVEVCGPSSALDILKQYEMSEDTDEDFSDVEESVSNILSGSGEKPLDEKVSTEKVKQSKDQNITDENVSERPSPADKKEEVAVLTCEKLIGDINIKRLERPKDSQTSTQSESVKNTEGNRQPANVNNEVKETEQAKPKNAKEENSIILPKKGEVIDVEQPKDIATQKEAGDLKLSNDKDIDKPLSNVTEKFPVENPIEVKTVLPKIPSSIINKPVELENTIKTIQVADEIKVNKEVTKLDEKSVTEIEKQKVGEKCETVGEPKDLKPQVTKEQKKVDISSPAKKPDKAEMSSLIKNPNEVKTLPAPEQPLEVETSLDAGILKGMQNPSVTKTTKEVETTPASEIHKGVQNLTEKSTEVKATPASEIQKEVKKPPSIEKLNEVKSTPGLETQKEIQEPPAIETLEEVKATPVLKIQKEVQKLPFIEKPKEVETTRGLKTQKEIQEQPVIETPEKVKATPVPEMQKEVQKVLSIGKSNEVKTIKGLETQKEIQKPPIIETPKEIKATPVPKIQKDAQNALSIENQNEIKTTQVLETQKEIQEPPIIETPKEIKVTPLPKILKEVQKPSSIEKLKELQTTSDSEIQKDVKPPVMKPPQEVKPTLHSEIPEAVEKPLVIEKLNEVKETSISEIQKDVQKTTEEPKEANESPALDIKKQVQKPLDNIKDTHDSEILKMVQKQSVIEKPKEVKATPALEMQKEVQKSLEIKVSKEDKITSALENLKDVEPKSHAVQKVDVEASSTSGKLKVEKPSTSEIPRTLEKSLALEQPKPSTVENQLKIKESPSLEKTKEVEKTLAIVNPSIAEARLIPEKSIDVEKPPTVQNLSEVEESQDPEKLKNIGKAPVTVKLMGFTETPVNEKVKENEVSSVSEKPKDVKKVPEVQKLKEVVAISAHEKPREVAAPPKKSVNVEKPKEVVTPAFEKLREVAKLKDIEKPHSEDNPKEVAALDLENPQEVEVCSDSQKPKVVDKSKVFIATADHENQREHGESPVLEKPPALEKANVVVSTVVLEKPREVKMAAGSEKPKEIAAPTAFGEQEECEKLTELKEVRTTLSHETEKEAKTLPVSENIKDEKEIIKCASTIKSGSHLKPNDEEKHPEAESNKGDTKSPTFSKENEGDKPLILEHPRNIEEPSVTDGLKEVKQVYDSKVAQSTVEDILIDKTAESTGSKLSDEVVVKLMEQVVEKPKDDLLKEVENKQEFEIKKVIKKTDDETVKKPVVNVEEGEKISELVKAEVHEPTQLEKTVVKENKEIKITVHNLPEPSTTPKTGTEEIIQKDEEEKLIPESSTSREPPRRVKLIRPTDFEKSKAVEKPKVVEQPKEHEKTNEAKESKDLKPKEIEKTKETDILAQDSQVVNFPKDGTLTKEGVTPSTSKEETKDIQKLNVKLPTKSEDSEKRKTVENLQRFDEMEKIADIVTMKEIETKSPGTLIERKEEKDTDIDKADEVIKRAKTLSLRQLRPLKPSIVPTPAVIASKEVEKQDKVDKTKEKQVEEVKQSSSIPISSIVESDISVKTKVDEQQSGGEESKLLPSTKTFENVKSSPEKTAPQNAITVQAKVVESPRRVKLVRPVTTPKPVVITSMPSPSKVDILKILGKPIEKPQEIQTPMTVGNKRKADPPSEVPALKKPIEQVKLQAPVAKKSAEPVKQGIPGDEKLVGAVKQDVPAVKKSVDSVDEAATSVTEPVELVKQDTTVVKKPIEPVKQAAPIIKPVKDSPFVKKAVEAVKLETTADKKSVELVKEEISAMKKPIEAARQEALGVKKPVELKIQEHEVLKKAAEPVKHETLAVGPVKDNKAIDVLDIEDEDNDNVNETKAEPMKLQAKRKELPKRLVSKKVESSKPVKKVIPSVESTQNKPLGYTLKIGKTSSTIVPKEEKPTSSKTVDNFTTQQVVGPKGIQQPSIKKVEEMLKETDVTITPLIEKETQQKLSKITLKIGKDGNHPEIKPREENWQRLDVDIVPVQKKMEIVEKRKSVDDCITPRKKIKEESAVLTTSSGVEINLQKSKPKLLTALISASHTSSSSDDVQIIEVVPPKLQSQDTSAGRHVPSSFQSEKDPILRMKHDLVSGQMEQPKKRRGRPRKIPLGDTRPSMQSLHRAEHGTQSMEGGDEYTSGVFPVPLFDMAESFYTEQGHLFPDQVVPSASGGRPQRACRGRIKLPVVKTRKPRGSGLSTRGTGRGRGRGFKRKFTESENIITLENVQEEMRRQSIDIDKQFIGREDPMDSEREPVHGETEAGSAAGPGVATTASMVPSAPPTALKKSPERKRRKKEDVIERIERIRQKKQEKKLKDLERRQKLVEAREREKAAAMVAVLAEEETRMSAPEGIKQEGGEVDDSLFDHGNGSFMDKPAEIKKERMSTDMDESQVTEVSTEVSLSPKKERRVYRCIICKEETPLKKLTSPLDHRSWRVLYQAAIVRGYEPIVQLTDNVTNEEIPPDILYHRNCRSEFTHKKTLAKLTESTAIELTPVYPKPLLDGGLGGAGSGDPNGGTKEFTVDQIAEYQWPLQGGELFMIQEQISAYLEIKSFKRKYPGIKRRPVEPEERSYLSDNQLVSESMCDLGLTAVSSAEVLDIMYADFQEKYEEFRKYIRDKQARELSSKHKAAFTSLLMDKRKSEQKSGSTLQEAIKSAASWNSNLNKSRVEERRCMLDLQSLVVHYPRSKGLKMTMVPNPPGKVGNYPIALIPGQYSDNYKRYTPAELRYFPLNTVLYGPMKPNERFGGGSDGSQTDSDDSSSSDDSSDSSSEGTQDTEGTCEEDEKERQLEEAHCKTCGGDKTRNKQDNPEVLIHCAQCTKSSQSQLTNKNLNRSLPSTPLFSKKTIKTELESSNSASSSNIISTGNSNQSQFRKIKTEPDGSVKQFSITSSIKQIINNKPTSSAVGKRQNVASDSSTGAQQPETKKIKSEPVN